MEILAETLSSGCLTESIATTRWWGGSTRSSWQHWIFRTFRRTWIIMGLLCLCELSLSQVAAGRLPPLRKFSISLKPPDGKMLNYRRVLVGSRSVHDRAKRWWYYVHAGYLSIYRGLCVITRDVLSEAGWAASGRQATLSSQLRDEWWSKFGEWYRQWCSLRAAYILNLVASTTKETAGLTFGVKFW